MKRRCSRPSSMVHLGIFPRAGGKQKRVRQKNQRERKRTNTRRSLMKQQVDLVEFLLFSSWTRSGGLVNRNGDINTASSFPSQNTRFAKHLWPPQARSEGERGDRGALKCLRFSRITRLRDWPKLRLSYTQKIPFRPPRITVLPPQTPAGVSSESAIKTTCLTDLCHSEPFHHPPTSACVSEFIPQMCYWKPNAKQMVRRSVQVPQALEWKKIQSEFKSRASPIHKYCGGEQNRFV